MVANVKIPSEPRKTARPRFLALAWVLTLTGLCGFIAMAILVTTRSIEHFDEVILLYFRDPLDRSNVWGPAWFEEMAAEITVLGGYTVIVLVTAIVLALLLMAGKKKAALFLFLTLVCGSILSSVLKLLFDRPRPDLVSHFDRTFTSSFPSAHAMVSMIAWLTLAVIAVRFVNRARLRVFILACAVIIAVMIGVSRVYLGVHWPSDVLAGWSMGIAWSGASWLAAHYFSQQPDRKGEFGQSRY